MKPGHKSRIRKIFKEVLFPCRKDEIIRELKNKLEEGNKKFEILSKGINDAIWDWNIPHGSIEWNHGLFEIYGYDGQKTPHNFQDWLDNVHPDDKQDVLKGIDETFAQMKSNWTSLYRYRCLNGSYKFTYDRGYVVYEGSKPARMMGAMHDIDDRMIALHEIEKLSLVASKTDNLVVITDADEKIEWVNQGFCRRTGFILSEVIGKNLAVLEGPETDKEALARIRNSIKKGEPVTEEILSYAKDGTKFWIKTNINPVFDEGHQVVKFVAIKTDITLQKEYEKKITDVALDLTNLIATINAPVFGLDRNGYINELNNRAAELTGFRKDEILAKKFIDELVEPEARKVVQEKLKEVYTGKPLSNLELPLVTKQQKQIVILLNATPRKKSSDQIESVFLVGQDITEFTQYRQSLEEMVKERTEELQTALKKEKELVTLKTRFASMVSHEFRTPLSTISISANYIKKFQSRLRPADIEKKIDIIHEQISHMTQLLEDVLTIGKSESGKIEITKRKIDLATLINTIKRDVENLFKNTHTIHSTLNVPQPEIWTDDGLFRNIFVNLLSNAIKFSPGKESVFLDAHQQDAFIVFNVKDEGIGIPDQDQERIFLPFDRGTNATAIPGTGLGLSIVKKAVDLLKGSIKVQSKPGCGSVVSVTIPIK